MNKPDTKAIRDNLKNPIVLPFGTCIPPEVYETTRNVLELCDYIDSLDEYGNPIDNARRLAWYLTLRTKIQDCPPENSPITGYFWRKNGVTDATEITELVNLHAEKAAADAKAQIREFVAAKQAKFDPDGNVYAPLGSILDFIDNGPKKPTASEIVHQIYRDEVVDKDPSGHPLSKLVANKAIRALREAGLLKEDS